MTALTATCLWLWFVGCGTGLFTLADRFGEQVKTRNQGVTVILAALLWPLTVPAILLHDLIED